MGAIIEYLLGIIQWFEDVYTAIKYGIDWIADGIYEFFVDVFTILVQWIFWYMLSITVQMLKFVWDVVVFPLLSSLAIQTQISSLWGLIPADAVAVLYLLQIPAALAVVFTAYITHFMLVFFRFKR